MGMFDRLLGRKSDDDSSAAGGNVPLKAFRKFQDEMQDGMRSMRGEFNKLVEENHTLKKQVLAVTDRLDDMQREQLKQGMETKKGLSNLSKSIVELGGKVKPEAGALAPIVASDDAQKKLSSAHSALHSLSARLVAPEDELPKLRPS